MDLHLKFGKNPPQNRGKLYTELENQVISVLSNTFNLNTWNDPWDRGGVIHQIFRRKYLATIYKDQSIFDDKKKFWEMHQKTDWAALDFIYKQVIEQRYL